MEKLIFLGDSLIEYFDWQDRFPKYLVSNLGLSGETVQELEGRCGKVLSSELDPVWIFIMIGTNNLGMGDYSFMNSYGNIVATVKEKFPRAKIVITGLFPMQLSWIAADAIPRVNKYIKELADDQDVYYMDGCEIFTSARLGAPSCFLNDGVHLSDYGYQVWADAVEKRITST